MRARAQDKIAEVDARIADLTTIRQALTRWSAPAATA
ncbi:hypothetical protein [Nonomuraea dietziae]